MKTGFELWADEYRGACVLEGKREGVLVGRREGEREKALKIADRLRREGVDVDTIARVTELTVDEILQL